ncbi:MULTISPECIES: hypothetical protein [Bartonella]|uniref:hypothetical protein n=1 Tax=Bartonella TaxID=773 RepID=UPI001ABC2589|nr:hypothetical protein [Bartonella capreoli]
MGVLGDVEEECGKGGVREADCVGREKVEGVEDWAVPVVRRFREGVPRRRGRGSERMSEI